MNLKLVKLDNFLGSEASVYTLKDLGNNKTLFDNFIWENINSFKSELNDIVLRLKEIGKHTGAREQFFKTKEGKPGDGVCALFDIPDSNLRLYCIRYGSTLIVLGGGGHKPKTVLALQEVPKLEEENKIVKIVSAQILERLKNKEIEYTNNYMDFEGDLEFYL